MDGPKGDARKGRAGFARRLEARTALIALALGALGGAPAERGDWTEVFDGKSLEGWVQLNGTATYAAQDRAIVGTTAEGSPNSFLATRKRYGDFELQFDVQLDSRLNSGVQIRSESVPEYRAGRVHGYQVEIATGGNAGRIYDEARRAKFLDEEPRDPRVRAAFRDGAWNRYRVLCVGDSIRTWVNGVAVADIKDSETKEGFIALQVHSFEGKPPAQVRWRNIFLREIGVAAAKEDPALGSSAAASAIDEVEKECLRRPVYTIGRERAHVLARLVRRTKPKLAVECGTAIGYSGLWIARELERRGEGKLITIEIDPRTAREAEENFRKAGLAGRVEVRVGDARELTSAIEGPVDFVFIDCGYENYERAFAGLEAKLRDGAIVVADNVVVGAAAMAGFLERVRSRYPSYTEFFERDLPWSAFDGMEVTLIRR